MPFEERTALAYYTVVQSPPYINYKRYINILNGEPLRNIYMGDLFTLSTVTSAGTMRFLTYTTLYGRPSINDGNGGNSFDNRDPIPPIDQKTY